MELTTTKLDIPSLQARGFKEFGDLITRGHANEIWMVPFKALDFQNTPDWRHFKKEPHIHIPVFSYLTDKTPTDAIGFAFQLGVRALHDLGGQPVRRLHLVMGEPVNEVIYQDQPALQVYMGFGVVLA